MRITFVLPTDSFNGGLRIVAGYVRQLIERGHAVTVVQKLHPTPTLQQRVRTLIQRRMWMPNRNHGPSHFTTIPAQTAAGGTYRRILLEVPDGIKNSDLPDADVIIATWWETAEWVAAAAPSKGAKAYFIQHHEVHMEAQPADRVNATWRLSLKKITIAPWLTELAKNEFGDSDVVTVPNAADTDLFFAPPRGKQATPTVGFMYSTVRFKGADIAVAAIELARQQRPDLQVRTFGAEAIAPWLAMPAGARFSYNPPQASIRDIYASCDAWLFGSRVEGFGLPILEAMACRTPVIATPAGAAPELVTPATGILVAPENPQAMADAILKIAAMPDAQWRALSDASFATVRRYTWNDAGDRFEAALKKISGH
jgi:glycosyltransferase involved in cell wall biosynthesis